MLLVFPSCGAINYYALRLTAVHLPPPTFSLLSVLGYGTVFFMTYGEELGLTGYALDPLQERHGALSAGLILGLTWAGYHIPRYGSSKY